VWAGGVQWGIRASVSQPPRDFILPADISSNTFLPSLTMILGQCVIVRWYLQEEKEVDKGKGGGLVGGLKLGADLCKLMAPIAAAIYPSISFEH